MDNLTDDLKGRLRGSAALNSPEVMRLHRLDRLIPDGDQAKDALSDLTPEQTKCIALFRALNDHLKAGGIEGGIDNFLAFFDHYEILAVSTNRKGRQEISGTFGERPAQYAPSMPTHDPYKEDDRPAWWQFWKRGDRE